MSSPFGILTFVPYQPAGEGAGEGSVEVSGKERGSCISVTYHSGNIWHSPGALENPEDLPGNDLGWGSQPFASF